MSILDGMETSEGREHSNVKVAEKILRSLPSRERKALISFYLDRQPEDQILTKFGLTATQFHLLRKRTRAEFFRLSKSFSIIRRPIAETRDVPSTSERPSVA